MCSSDLNGKTNLPSFPFDFSWLWRWVPTLIQVKLFWKNFVLKIWVLVKVLQKELQVRFTPFHYLWKSLLWQCCILNPDTYKIYSIAWLDVLKLGNLHSGKVMKCLLIFLTKKSWNCWQQNKETILNVNRHINKEASDVRMYSMAFKVLPTIAQICHCLYSDKKTQMYLKWWDIDRQFPKLP